METVARSKENGFKARKDSLVQHRQAERLRHPSNWGYAPLAAGVTRAMPDQRLQPRVAYLFLALHLYSLSNQCFD